MTELVADDDQAISLDAYRDAVGRLGTEDIVIVRSGAKVVAHRRADFIDNCPAFADRFSEPARHRWAEEIARGEGGVAFFWLVTLDAKGGGSSECRRIRLSTIGTG